MRKRSRKTSKMDVATQTISTILLFLDDQISHKEFDQVNRKLLNSVKSKVQLPMHFDPKMLARQFT